jgi:GNAT superfamily N-acetyltransferase
VTATPPPGLAFRPLSPATFADFAALHERPECQGCFCMYWQFPGDNRAWQLSDADANRAAKRALVEAGATHGLLAYDGTAAIGSVQFEPRDALPKLAGRGPYRGLDPGAHDAWVLSCFRVLEAQRHRGVARALLDAALSHLRTAHGAAAVYGYPRRGDELRDDEVLTGPEGLFAAAGFELVRDHVQYPVYRKTWP